MLLVIAGGYVWAAGGLCVAICPHTTRLLFYHTTIYVSSYYQISINVSPYYYTTRFAFDCGCVCGAGG